MTFDREVQTKCVTIAGDVYDPSGTMTGGSAPAGNRILIEVQELLQVEAELAEARARLEGLEREEGKLRVVRDQWRALGNALEMTRHQLALSKEQVGSSNASRVSLHLSLFDAITYLYGN